MKDSSAALETTDYTKTMWKQCLEIIKANVPPITYNTWFIPIKPIDYSNDVLKIQVPNNYFIEWIDEHYNTLINKVISQVLGENGKLVYVIVEEKDNLFEAHEIIEVVKKQPEAQISAVSDIDSHINPRYKFENFIKGEGNQLARAASIAISDNPGETSFNPFFIYGGVGLGKTHLIQAVGNKILEKHSSKKVIYLSSEHFTVEFVDAIQSNTVNEFSSYYKNMDVLIIDDIQFLIGKEKTQDLFFHIFNTLHQSGKQIINIKWVS